MVVKFSLYLFCVSLLLCNCSRSGYEDSEICLNLFIPETWESGKLEGFSYGGDGGRFSFLHRGFFDKESSHAVWMDLVENQENGQNLVGVVLYRLDLKEGKIWLDVSSEVEFMIKVSGAVDVCEKIELDDKLGHRFIEIKL